MGAQIAAHLANAGLQVVLFDLAAKEGDKSGIVKKAIDGLKKLEPAPLASKAALKYIVAANYDEHLPLLADCDLVIEAIAERVDWKNDLYARIAPFLSATAIVASNTSGLSINALADGLPAEIRPRFCGIHFFNPPRYMRLVEIIATETTGAGTLDALETWLTSRLGKGVVRALDTPNFVANRIGVFSILAVMHHTQRFELGFDTVDALTGPKIGRPKSATYRTADVVGLDTLAHVIRTMQATLPDDPWHCHFKVPAWLDALIEKGALGQKSKGGIFRKAGKAIHVLDLGRQDWRPSTGEASPEVAAILKERDPHTRFARLRESTDRQARFLWAIFRDVFHYAAVQLESVADNARDLDLAMRWGFGWALGPFEIWQSAGWADIAQAIVADIAAGEAMSSAPLPDWVFDGRSGVHAPAGSWSASRKLDVPPSSLPVYQRQLFPARVLGDGSPAPGQSGETLYENEGVRLWRLPAVDAGIGILSFKSKMHAIGADVLAGLQESLRLAERTLSGVVLWHDAPFAVGANLAEIGGACASGDFARLEGYVEDFQRASLAIKYAPVPVVAAVQGMALGGGCEFAMHAARRVLALESYMGLVEAGVGLIPAGGGCKELALQAAEWASRTATPNDLLAFLQPAFMNIATGKVSKSAPEAVGYGFARAADTVLFNADELLYVAIHEARALATAGYAPKPMARGIPVAGRAGIASLDMALINMRDGAMISAYDYQVARAAAVALCGGEIDAGSLVDEAWLLAVERQLFVGLLKNPETQARIKHMLETGKVLRN
jgi:3-hydroxyacyl-CoA dehydrogenase